MVVLSIKNCLLLVKIGFSLILVILGWLIISCEIWVSRVYKWYLLIFFGSMWFLRIFLLCVVVIRYFVKFIFSGGSVIVVWVNLSLVFVLFSKIIGLKFGFVLIVICSLLVFVCGVIFCNEKFLIWVLG